jgi:pimeloyl-ACP methyl ester carboxylesterase
LAASDERGPYIFAGWSMGGGLTWLYTQEHLDEAAGIIMVDGMPRDMYRFVAMGADPTPRGLGRILSLVIDRAGLTAAVLALLAPGVDEASRRELPESTVALLDRSQFLSEGIVPAVFSVPSVVEAARAISPLGDLPLIVIARGMPGDFFDPLGDRKDEAETLWREMQTEMSTLSSDSRLWIAEQSDHGVPLRQPGIVVDAIRELVQRYRSSAGRPARYPARKPDRTIALGLSVTTGNGAVLEPVSRTIDLSHRPDLPAVEAVPCDLRVARRYLDFP